MTVYYLSQSSGVVPTQATVTEGTSDPTTSADVTLRIGDQVPIGNLPRSYVIESLRTFIAYLKGDSPNVGGANNIPLQNG